MRGHWSRDLRIWTKEKNDSGERKSICKCSEAGRFLMCLRSRKSKVIESHSEDLGFNSDHMGAFGGFLCKGVLWSDLNFKKEEETVGTMAEAWRQIIRQFQWFRQEMIMDCTGVVANIGDEKWSGFIRKVEKERTCEWQQWFALKHLEKYH